jgi:hypothetical protein
MREIDVTVRGMQWQSVARWLAVVALGSSACGESGGSEADANLPDNSAGGSAGSSGDVGAACNESSDCTAPESECRSNACDDGMCGYAFAASGAELSAQVAGDCKRVVCSGTGSEVSEDDASDGYDDGKDCTEDVCTDDGPRNQPLPSGSPCGDDDQGKCNGAGLCSECVANDDCPGEACVQNTCVPLSCTDQVLSDDETDVDCGGPDCVPCDSGQGCQIGSDCSSGTCEGDVCQAGQCEDGIQNGDETDADCGGSSCPSCGPGQGCSTDTDCTGLECSGTTCLANCSDGVRNQNETGVDCGGPDCSACGIDDLSTAGGCLGVYNHTQLLDYELSMSAGDWSALKADSTNSQFFMAQLACENGDAITVGVRRKRSGGTDKPGIKIDINYFTPGQEYYGLKKLSFENGISEGSGEVEVYDLVAEYLSWRVVQLSGTIGSRAAFARLSVNGDLVGTYVNVEQVDKAFLTSRIGDDSGWLYKKSGSMDDGYKTNETQANPYEDDMCFWDNNPCAVPAELETYLPAQLDINQMLLMGGVNAIISNEDAPLVKSNNYYFYDYAAGPRLYFPWDLDTTQKTQQNIFDEPGATMYKDVLFAHWEDDYDTLLTSLLDGPLALSVITGEIELAVSVAGAALDADPAVSGDGIDDAATKLETYWSSRHPALVSELESHGP